jgi:hypothetical protein
MKLICTAAAFMVAASATVADDRPADLGAQPKIAAELRLQAEALMVAGTAASGAQDFATHVDRLAVVHPDRKAVAAVAEAARPAAANAENVSGEDVSLNEAAREAASAGLKSHRHEALVPRPAGHSHSRGVTAALRADRDARVAPRSRSGG